MATAPSPNDLTRQQLDELDALLQRMLSVPLAPPETPMPSGVPVLPTPPTAHVPVPPAPTPPALPSWRVDPPVPPASVSSPHLVIVEPPSSVTLKPAPAPTPAPVPAPKPVAPAPAPAPAKTPPAPQPAARLTPPPAMPPVPFLFLPFVAISTIFNVMCGLFGPPGRLLRSGFFKHIYGLVGLGLLLYTAAHVAQEQGWLTLPITLPWPR